MPAGTEVDLQEDSGKAYHSIYFEVLGEHGYVGLAIYLALLLQGWRILRAVSRRHAERPWVVGMAKALRDSLLIFAVCGNFIAVAFTQWPYYLIGLAVCLDFVARRTATGAVAPARGPGSKEVVRWST